MRSEGPSRTAAGVAYRRAVHQLVDQPPVFVDPLAQVLLSPDARAVLASDPWRGNRSRVASYLRAFLAVRSRVAEDTLAHAVVAGVRQYVVLGAGLDTFACRNPWQDLRVFEVDHPQTQEWKLARLGAAGLSLPHGTAFVPVNFEVDTVPEALLRHGFDPDRPTAVSWLGVVPYLEEATVWATLEWAAEIVGASGHIVFDYGSRPRWWQLAQRVALRRLAARVAALGEPFRTRLEPRALRQRLLGIGFRSVVDLDGRELNRRYFTGRPDRLRVGGSGHIAIASL
ncbi:MAG: class I SAM-dependent methyltransferase [Gemmatimonadales bacterium]